MEGLSLDVVKQLSPEAEALADQVFLVDQGRGTISGTVRQLTKSGGSLETVFLAHTSARART